MDAGQHAPTPATRSRPVSRRAVLLTGGAAVVAGGGAGVAVGALRTVASPPAVPAPPALVSALSAEDDLLAALHTALAAGPSAPMQAALTAIRNDHLAHRVALQGALAGYRPAGSGTGQVVSGSPLPAGPAGSPSSAPRSAAALSAAEQRASTAAVAHAAALTGRDATLLASIAACEATHAAWLTALS